MPFEFIQIPANRQDAAKETLNALLRGGRIASVRKEFVANAEDSFWAFCVEYLDGASAADKGRSGPKVDYKEVLSEPDFALFCQLRDLRKALAEKEAVPAYPIFPGFSEPNRRSRVRCRRRLSLLGALYDAGRISERETQERLAAATAFLLPTRSRLFRARAMERIRSAAIGHEPGEPGRQLEQQRDQRALREPQQQHARQHEQQQRLPACPQLRPAVPEGAAMSPRGLNRPPSCSAGETPAHEATAGAPGAGSAAEAVSKAPGALTVVQPRVRGTFGSLPVTHPHP